MIVHKFLKRVTLLYLFIWIGPINLKKYILPYLAVSSNHYPRFDFSFSNKSHFITPINDLEYY